MKYIPYYNTVKSQVKAAKKKQKKEIKSNDTRQKDLQKNRVPFI